MARAAPAAEDEVTGRASGRRGRRFSAGTRLNDSTTTTSNRSLLRNKLEAKYARRPMKIDGAGGAGPRRAPPYEYCGVKSNLPDSPVWSATGRSRRT